MTNRNRAAAREAWACIADLWFGEETSDRFHDACEAIDVSPPQLKALMVLKPGQGEPMRALAEVMRCDASWITELVDGLEARGYVKRQQHPRDRRAKVVTITSVGEKAKAKAFDRLHEPPSSLGAALDAQELRTLRDLLRKVRDASKT